MKALYQAAHRQMVHCFAEYSQNIKRTGFITDKTGNTPYAKYSNY